MCEVQTTISPFQTAHHSRNHKNVLHYSLFGDVFHAKTYPGVLNISMSISTAHQSIDILKVSVSHFHYIVHYQLLDIGSHKQLSIEQTNKHVHFARNVPIRKKLANRERL